MFEMLPGFVLGTLNVLATLFVFAIGCVILGIAVLYAVDRLQTANTVRRNYPVIGRLRSFFEHLGEFFRQYFFAMDREELPFNRAQRNWAYRASPATRTIPSAFGSTRDLQPGGHADVRRLSLFPRWKTDAVASPRPLPSGRIAEHPYAQDRIFNISGMSYGALSRVAVKSLSRGAAHAGCWYNTGEGAMSEFHLEGGCDIVFQIGTAKYGCRKEDGTFCEETLAKSRRRIPKSRCSRSSSARGPSPARVAFCRAHKVTAEIAKNPRHSRSVKDSISPNRHVEIDNPAELLDFIDRVRRVPRASRPASRP